MARPGPGNGWRPTKSSGRPSSRPSARTSSLNSSRSGSTSFMFMRSGRPPTLWCDLDRDRRAAGEGDALDHVGIERALRQEFGAADLLRLFLEHVDEQRADGLALRLGIADAVERAEEQLGGVDMDQRDVVVVAEQVARPRSASSSRIRPWSTKMQVSWSPIASWISTAATEESTPPDRPQITRPSPTWARICAIASVA